MSVKRLGIVGAIVRDQVTPKSDVEVLAEFEQEYTSLDSFIAPSFFLEALLQPSEVVIPESLIPCIGPQILELVEYITDFEINNIQEKQLL